MTDNIRMYNNLTECDLTLHFKFEEVELLQEAMRVSGGHDIFKYCKSTLLKESRNTIEYVGGLKAYLNERGEIKPK